VTSRDRLDGLVARDGAVPVPLDVLPDDDAVELVARVVGARRCAAEMRACRQLVELCDRLPLALRIGAARLASAPDQPIADLVRELATDGNRLDGLSIEGGETSVRAALALTYRRLAPWQARAFRLLGLHPGVDFAVPALAGVDHADAEHGMADLVAAHLVAERTPGRYAMHDLMYAFARDRAADEPPAEGRAAVTRLAAHYRHAAVNSERMISPDLPISAAEPGDRPPAPLTFDSAATA
jgi:hypothetical protein